MRLYRCGLVTAPHGAIESDVALDKACAEYSSRVGGLQAYLVPRIPNRAIEHIAECLYHPQVELLGRTGIRASSMGNEEIICSDNLHRSLNLIHRRHARG